jgi:hypothetical protein
LSDRGVDGVEEFDAEPEAALLVPPARRAILFVGFGLEPNVRVHDLRSSASSVVTPNQV